VGAVQRQQNTTSVEPLTVSIKEACRLLGVNNNTIYKLIGTGALPSFKIGRRRFISLAALREFVASGRDTPTDGERP
jgi:excisionase family DNA binding protein